MSWSPALWIGKLGTLLADAPFSSSLPHIAVSRALLSFSLIELLIQRRKTIWRSPNEGVRHLFSPLAYRTTQIYGTWCWRSISIRIVSGMRRKHLTRFINYL